jgi:hypothetical protein
VSAEVVATLERFMEETSLLRTMTEVPSVAATVGEVQSYLLDVRRRQDRVEELLRTAIRIRARAHRVATRLDATANDAWDSAAVRARTAVVQPGDGFSSARERAAEANLTILDQRVTARHAAELAHVCDEAVEFLRIAFRGLDGLRYDITQLLRTYLLESHLER